MNKYFTLYKIEQRLFLRNPDVIIFNLCMPVGTFMIIALIAGKQVANIQGMTYLQSSFAALTTVGICCSAFMSIPIVFVDYRDKKILKHFYTSPCSPFVLLCVDVLCSLVMSILSAILIFIVASLFYG
ncbi:MAG: ABC transporter permease, partial [Faecalibacillus sp.]